MCDHCLKQYSAQIYPNNTIDSINCLFSRGTSRGRYKSITPCALMHTLFLIRYSAYSVPVIGQIYSLQQIRTLALKYLVGFYFHLYKDFGVHTVAENLDLVDSHLQNSLLRLTFSSSRNQLVPSTFRHLSFTHSSVSSWSLFLELEINGTFKLERRIDFQYAYGYV